MRRWFAVLLLMLLPLQAVWAAAPPYSAHEEDPAAMHVGHHAHSHQDAQQDAQQEDDSSEATAGSHADCHVCHGAGAVVSTQQADASHGAYRGPLPMWVKALPAPPVFTPDRPNWSSLA